MNGSGWTEAGPATGEDVPGDVQDIAGADPVADLRATLVQRQHFGGPGCPDFLARVLARKERREVPVKTPWPAVDAALGGGLWPGCHFLVGGTGCGKSQWSMQVAIRAALEGSPALYVALELGEFDLWCRALGALGTGRAWSRYFLGQEVPAREDMDRLRSLPFHWALGDARGWHHRQIVQHARAMRAEYSDPRHGGKYDGKPLLLVVDFAQLVAGDERELRERIAAASYQARMVGRDPELNVAVLMVSSTARANYGAIDGGENEDGNGNGRSGGNGRRPRKPAKPPWEQWPGRFVGLGKESGETEYSADSVLALVREPPEDGASSTPVHLAVAKWRAGPPAWVRLTFNGTMFREDPTAKPGASAAVAPLDPRTPPGRDGSGRLIG